MNYNRIYLNPCAGTVTLGGRLNSIPELPFTAPRKNHGDRDWDASPPSFQSRWPDTDDQSDSREEKTEAERV